MVASGGEIAVHGDKEGVKRKKNSVEKEARRKAVSGVKLKGEYYNNLLERGKD